jgi:hypothetical protein
MLKKSKSTYNPADWELTTGRIRKSELEEIKKLYKLVFEDEPTKYVLVQKSLFLLKEYLKKKIKEKGLTIFMLK